MGNPFKSRPSLRLTVTTILIVMIGIGLTYTPFAGLLGFTVLPRAFFAFLVISTATYLLFVEWAKRLLFARAAV
jgi:Mg2+-importing ATPase